MDREALDETIEEDVVERTSERLFLPATTALWWVPTQPENFETVRQSLEKASIHPNEAKLSMIPMSYIKLDDVKGRQTMRLLEMLDDHDDVQNVWSNFDIPDEYLT